MYTQTKNGTIQKWDKERFSVKWESKQTEKGKKFADDIKFWKNFISKRARLQILISIIIRLSFKADCFLNHLFTQLTPVPRLLLDLSKLSQPLTRGRAINCLSPPRNDRRRRFVPFPLSFECGDSSRLWPSREQSLWRRRSEGRKEGVDGTLLPV
jgi:hypothetical protein